MSDITTIAATDLVSSSRTTINNNFSYLQNHFKSATAPASPVAGQMWLEDDNPSATVWTLWIYDGAGWIEIGRVDSTNNVWQLGTGNKLTTALNANSAKIESLATGTASTDAVNKAQVDAMIHTNTIPLGTQSATFDRFLAIGRGTMTILDCKLLVGTTIASSGTDYWTFQIRNVTAAVNLLSTAATTNGTAATADTAFSITPNQNATLTNGDVLQLQVTKTLSPTAIDAEGCIVLTYKVAV